MAPPGLTRSLWVQQELRPAVTARSTQRRKQLADFVVYLFWTVHRSRDLRPHQFPETAAEPMDRHSNGTLTHVQLSRDFLIGFPGVIAGEINFQRLKQPAFSRG